MVKDLKQLFLRPRCNALYSQIVKDKNCCVANFVKQAIVACFAAGTESGAQMVQQIGHDDKYGRLIVFDAVVGNGRGQVGLATSISPCEEQPADGLLGKCPRSFVGPDQVIQFVRLQPGQIGVERFKSESG